jgi:hypothetical protein
MRGRGLLLLIAASCGHPAPARPAAAPATGTGGIAGIVRDRDSAEPVSFVTVRALGDGSGKASTATNGGGGFVLEGLPPGRYTVTANWSGTEVTQDKVRVVAGRYTKVDLRLPLEPTSHPVAALGPGVEVNLRPDAPSVAVGGARGGIRGVVRDKVTSDLLVGAVVSAITPGVRDAVLSMADDEGRFRMHALAPGLYTLSAYYQVIGRGAIEIRRTNVRVVAGEITVIDLDLDAQAQP